jgi:putative lipoprotein
MLVFEGSSQGLKLASKISLVRGPLIVSNEVSNGWRDIVMQVSGGGMPPKRVALKHDGRRYPGNPSMLPPIAEDAVVEGVEVFGWP